MVRVSEYNQMDQDRPLAAVSGVSEDSKEAKAKLQSLGGFAKGMGRRPRTCSDPIFSAQMLPGVEFLPSAGPSCAGGSLTWGSLLVAHRCSGTLAVR